MAKLFNSIEFAVHLNNKFSNIEKMSYLLVKLLDRKSFKNFTRFKIVRTKLFIDKRNVTGVIWG